MDDSQFAVSPRTPESGSADDTYIYQNARTPG